MASSSTPPLGKFLASTDKATRDKAIKKLAGFLSDTSYENEGLPKSEMAKLWKGIFYCFWMSDKPLVQQALATELANLLLTIADTRLSLNFLRGFWESTVREWNGIDRLRMDKYYMLIRRFVNASFRLLIRAQFKKEYCEEYNDILTCSTGPLFPNDTKIPTGLAYHLADIYLEELDKALATHPDSPSLTPPPLVLLLSPFYQLAAQTPNSTTFKRVHSSIFEPLFDAFSEKVELEDGPKRKRARVEKVALPLSHVVSNVDEKEKPELAQALFQVASAQTTRDSNRRKMYSLWRDVRTDDDDNET